jgi:hypothetical protein
MSATATTAAEKGRPALTWNRVTGYKAAISLMARARP